MNACEIIFRQGLAEMNIELEEEKITQLLRYLVEFEKWNKAYNLSAIRDPLVMVERHLLDSLVLVPILQEKNNEDTIEHIIDVGTGGGLPGIPLSIVFPEINFVLLDSNGKKTRFLFHVKNLLGLTNVTIENCRVEQYRPIEKFDIIVSRAFASLLDMVIGTEHLLKQCGRFWAMKGVYPEKELRDCEKHAIVDTAITLSVPNQEGERHLLLLKANNGKDE